MNWHKDGPVGSRFQRRYQPFQYQSDREPSNQLIQICKTLPGGDALALQLTYQVGIFPRVNENARRTNENHNTNTMLDDAAENVVTSQTSHYFNTNQAATPVSQGQMSQNRSSSQHQHTSPPFQQSGQPRESPQDEDRRELDSNAKST